MADRFSSHGTGLTAPATKVVAVTLDDSNDLAIACRGFMVTTGGNVKVTTVEGDQVVIPGCQPGLVYPIRATRIWNSSTTATGVVALI